MAANASAIAVVDSKVGNNIAGIKNALAINVATNCLKKQKK